MRIASVPILKKMRPILFGSLTDMNQDIISNLPVQPGACPLIITAE